MFCKAFVHFSVSNHFIMAALYGLLHKRIELRIRGDNHLLSFFIAHLPVFVLPVSCLQIIGNIVLGEIYRPLRTVLLSGIFLCLASLSPSLLKGMLNAEKVFRLLRSCRGILRKILDFAPYLLEHVFVLKKVSDEFLVREDILTEKVIVQLILGVGTLDVRIPIFGGLLLCVVSFLALFRFGVGIEKSGKLLIVFRTLKGMPDLVTDNALCQGRRVHVEGNRLVRNFFAFFLDRTRKFGYTVSINTTS